MNAIQQHGYGEPLLMRPALGGARAPRRVIGTDFAGVIERAGSTADLDELRSLIDAGDVRPVIDSEYPLEQAAEALTHVRSGHPGGKVVLTLAA